ncbi:MAG: hypothetical protein IJT79_04335 [Ruminococcus sp.]|nr:hypothetical protein [Ruminococcus sp.]
MKKKNSKRENVNLFFSAFLMLAYIVCGYFFAQFANTVGGETAKAGVTAIIFVIFGLLVFYATRVGEGKAIKRFSLLTLIVLDIPALYIILASVFAFIPLHAQLADAPVVAYMAAIALGYGIPYTFLSGFETAFDETEKEAAEAEEEPAVLEGGVEADIEEEEEAVAEEEPIDEVVVEGEAADTEEPAEEVKEEAEEVSEAKTEEE